MVFTVLRIRRENDNAVTCPMPQLQSYQCRNGSTGCLSGPWLGPMQTAREDTEYLGEPLGPLLISSLEKLGGAVTWATKGRVSEARDPLILKSFLLTGALLQHRPEKDRHVWA